MSPIPPPPANIWGWCDYHDNDDDRDDDCDDDGDDDNDNGDAEEDVGWGWGIEDDNHWLYWLIIVECEALEDCCGVVFCGLWMASKSKQQQKKRFFEEKKIWSSPPATMMGTSFFECGSTWGNISFYILSPCGSTLRRNISFQILSNWPSMRHCSITDFYQMVNLLTIQHFEEAPLETHKFYLL